MSVTKQHENIKKIGDLSAGDCGIIVDPQAVDSYKDKIIFLCFDENGNRAVVIPDLLVVENVVDMAELIVKVFPEGTTLSLEV